MLPYDYRKKRKQYRLLATLPSFIDLMARIREVLASYGRNTAEVYPQVVLSEANVGSSRITATREVSQR